MYKNKRIEEIVSNISELTGILNAMDQCQKANRVLLAETVICQLQEILKKVEQVKNENEVQINEPEVNVVEQQIEPSPTPLNPSSIDIEEINLFKYPEKQNRDENKPIHRNEENIETKTTNISKDKKRGDIAKLMSLNDRFLFKRELFDNDEKRFKEVLEYINNSQYQFQVTNYLNTNFQWDSESISVIDFMVLVEKHFKE